MKYIILVLLFFGFVSLDAQTYYYENEDSTRLTNADTVTFTIARSINTIGAYEAHVQCDSVSGNPAGTISYQYSLDPVGRKWYTASTDAVDGVQTDAQHKVTDFVGRRARVQIITSGTQVSDCFCAHGFKINR